ncbi:Phosphate/phosphoenolpyruvate translocator protein, putative [Trichomonas vaginalis G3]|uniref:Phosphate/phosphoenolpyruvate translocator protein, putative n=1 Tax=Trichomonas vaginalis (strain ATCC PRA-98 / G3) TaxID=412133 RepID=A2FBC6_TRIV3|nr:carbohydrate transport [Trichomonas vaginalis G3]EAX97806.1 Phosphate/phosphoenolpyruvate translocator protein, putative [Trichomonas vaginalis G3]KAI5552718.1 carbohydrate transport [Trichomonas vaginalis G3]|eukprot:XP_001310736.1 Phosphate/phosphoenolpyruvate translocator protein [Trichomonas vaginalis G3]
MSFMHQSTSTFFSFFESTVLSKENDKSVTIKNGIPIEQFEKTVMFRIVSLSLLFTLNIVTGNISLNYCSVAFTQVVRAIIPMITMVFSFFFLNQKYGMQHILSCLIISIGVALSCMGEINLTLRGFIITVIGCILSSAKSISIKLCLSGQYTLKSADLLARISPFSAIEMFVLACVDGEPQHLLGPKSKYKASVVCIGFSLLSGVMAYFLNLTNFLATQHTSPLTVTIAGCVKQIVTIVLSVMMFDKHLTTSNIIGIIITTIGSTWYSFIGLNNNNKKRKTEVSGTEESNKPLVSSQNNIFPGVKDYEQNSNVTTENDQESRATFELVDENDKGLPLDDNIDNNEEDDEKKKDEL